MGPGVRLCVASAARQQAWSLYLFDKCKVSGDTEDAIKASRLANEARQNIMAAREMAIKEAAGRFGKNGKRRGPPDPLAKFQEAEFEEDDTNSTEGDE